MKQLIKYCLNKLGYTIINQESNSLIAYLAKIDPCLHPILLENLKIQLEEQGYLETLKPFNSPYDIKNPIPWFPFSAVDFLNQLDLSDKTVFEYGCGVSTLYWAKRVKWLHGVENNKEWYKKLAIHQPKNVTLILQEDKSFFANTIKDYPQKYDIIVIDDLNRLDCVKESLPYLAEGGMMIIDDAQRYHKIHSFLLDSGFFYVSFNDFKSGTPRRHSSAIYIRNNGTFSFKQKETINCIGKYEEIIAMK